MIYTLLWTYCFLFCANMENNAPCYLIRKIEISYKKPRPHEPKTTLPTRYCLLNICPERPGEIARRVIEVTLEGKKTWREFEVEKEFQTEEEAVAYAEKYSISIDIVRKITGKALNSKSGAVIKTTEGLVYHLAGKEAWSEAEEGKTFSIEGVWKQISHEENTLLDDKGNYRAGLAGKQDVLEDWYIVKE